MINKLGLVECEQKYWEFVRLLRVDERVIDGFIEKLDITPEQQQIYMSKYSHCFRIALFDGQPAGYFGVIDDDIRVCVHPDFQRKGVGKFLVNSCFKIWPMALAKIKTTNQPSQKLFESCGYKREYFLYTKESR